MASDHSDAIQVKPEDLYDPSEGGFAGAPVAHVDGVQEVNPNEEQKNVLEKEQKMQEKQSAPITHETDKVKTTYDTEEDAPKESMKSKIKDKMEQFEDKLRPKDAAERKKADPHPGFV